MAILYYDTETTGKNPNEAHIVQLAAILLDETGRPMGTYSAICKPVIPVPAEALAIHGLTDEIIERFAVPEKSLLSTFARLVDMADTIAGHNVQYDDKVTHNAYIRTFDRVPEKFTSLPRYCTMEASTNICRLPGRYPGKYKWPRLDEAYRILVDPEGFEGAHDALADIQATIAVHRALIARSQAA